MAPKRKRKSTPTPNSPKSTQNLEEDGEVSFRVGPEAKRIKVEPSPSSEEPRRSPNGFILPDPLPKNYVLEDNTKQKWVLGISIGLGGFGEIYSARRFGEKEEKYVIKVEPHSNGPLFTEIAFYLKCAKSENIEKWKESRSLEHLGVANFVASGSLMLNNKRFRFLVLPKYGIDLQTLMESSEAGHFNIKTACSIVIQVIDALEFIHYYGYIHKDIKGSNLLLGVDGDKHRVFLIDFGLCSRYIQCNLHKPFISDQRWAHEGTVEYTSRDSHLGMFSRRGDTEVLLYNLIEWLGGILPWDDLEDAKPPVVQERKLSAFSDTSKFLSSCFKGKTVPRVLEEFAYHVASLSFEEAPAYDWLRDLFKHEITQSIKIFDEVQLNVELDRKQMVSGSNKNIQYQVGGEKENENPLSERNRPKHLLLKTKTQPMILDLRRKHDKNAINSHVSLTCYNYKRSDKIRQINEESLKNPTPAMVQQIAKMNKRLPTPKKKANLWRNMTPTKITPAMQEVIDKRKPGYKYVKNESISTHSDKDFFPFLGSPLKSKNLRKHESTAFIAMPKSGSKSNGLRRNQILPDLKSELAQNSLKNRITNVVEAGSRLIQGISRSLFSNFTN